MPSRVPEAHGSLGKTPLAQVLVSVAQRGLSGSLLLREGATLHGLVFREGALERISTPLVPLAEVLATLGAIDEAEIAFAIEHARSVGAPLGAQLVDDGLAEPETVETAIAAQTEERLVSLAALPGTTEFSFFSGTDALEGILVDPCTVDPLAGIMLCARSITDPAPIDRVLDGLGARRLVFHTAADLDRFGLTRAEQAAASVLQWASRTWAELAQSVDDGLEELRLVTYVLAIARHLELGADSWPVGVARPEPAAKAQAPAREPPPAASSSRSPVAPTPARAPLASQPVVTAVSPVEIRERGPAPSSPIPATAVTPVSGVRPTEQPAAASVRPTSPSISGDAGDAAPISIRPSRIPTALDAATIAAMSTDDRVVEATSYRQRAEVLLSRNDTAGAEQAAALAVELHRDNADGLALLGWLRAMKPGATSLSDGLKHLDEAIRLSPKLDRALYYRGALLKRANRLDEALRDFKAAVDVNPKNMDAVREVRLHTMRAGDKGDKKRLLGKLFGK